MENILNKVIDIEERIFTSIDLLEIAKIYCESNFDKGMEISALGTMIELILREQRVLADSLDGLV